MSSGRTTAAWNRLRALAIERAGYACADCGRVLPKGKLHGHLDPSLAGDHRKAKLEDITILCARCHGTRDAPRSHSAQALHVAPHRDGPSIG